MGYVWMSFCDPTRSKGEHFLGALIIRADEIEQALHRSWMLELNPGGEVMSYEIPEEYHERIPPEWVETRLITKSECDEFERKWAS